MSDSPETDPVERFLKDAEQRLRLQLLSQDKKVVLDEARDHLTQRVEELIADGIEPSLARTVAVESFGNVRRWTREIVDSAYGDRWTKPATTTAIAGATIVFALPLLAEEFLAQYSYPFPDSAMKLLNIAVIALLSLGVTCFMAGSAVARRFLIIKMAVSWVCVVLIGLLVTGTTRVQVPTRLAGDPDSNVTRAQMASATREIERQIVLDQKDLQLLTAGMATYGSDNRHGHLQPELKTANGFIAPSPFLSKWSKVDDRHRYNWISPFNEEAQNQKDNPITLLARHRHYHTVTSAAKAAQAWQSAGPLWLTRTTLAIRMCKTDRDLNEKALKRAPLLDAEAGWQLIQIDAKMAELVLVGSSIASAVGWLIFRYLRRRRLQAT